MGREWKGFEGRAKSIDVTGDSGEISDGNQKRIIRNWRRGDSYYKMARNLAELFLVFCRRYNFRVIKLDI